MTEPRRTQVFLCLFSFTQHLPFTFMLIAVPALMREAGMSLDQIGLVGLAFAPVALAFLWAGFLDRWQVPGFGRWKGWLVVTELLGAAGLFFLAIFSPVDQFAAFFIATFFLSIVAGTQKIAQGAYAIQTMPEAHRPKANLALGLGAAAGTALGTIGLIWALESYGWAMAMTLCALGMLAIAMITIWAPKIEGFVERPEGPRGLVGIKHLQGGRSTLLLIFNFCLPIGLLYGLTQPLLIDAGYTLTDVGLINGLGYLAVWIVFGTFAARFISCFSSRRVDTAIHISLALVASVMLINAVLNLVGLTVILQVLLVYAALCFVFVRLYTRIMQVARPASLALDFGLFAAAFAMVLILSGALAGIVAERYGYELVFACCMVFSGFLAALISCGYHQRT